MIGAVEISEQRWFFITDSLPEEYAYIVSSTEAELTKVNWRSSCGLLYEFSQNRVYLLGGLRLSVATTTANSFALSSRRNQPLGGMNQSRSDFAPCWHGQFAYLIGGGAHFIETFHPIQSVFTVLPDLMLPVEGRCHTVSVEDCIYILGKQLVAWRPETGVVKIGPGVRYRASSACAVVYQGCLILPLIGVNASISFGIEKSNFASC